VRVSSGSLVGPMNHRVGVAVLQWLHESTGGKAPVEGEGESIPRFERKFEIEAILFGLGIDARMHLVLL